jgi:hypothetical protein
MTGSGMRPLDRQCGEQGKLPTAKKFILPERDINMSEQEKQKSSFMQELDKWSEAEIISPLLYAGAQSVEDEDFDSAKISEEKRLALRAKVLESYRNGLAAGRREANAPTRPQYPQRGYRTAEGRSFRQPAQEGRKVYQR